MSSIPSNLARVSNQLSAQIMLSSLTRTNQSLLNMQTKLASGQAVNRPSDDPLAASTISVLDDVLERRDQRMRNLSHAEAVMNNVDAALSDATSIVMEARSIGLSQIGVGSDAQTRETQAVVIDSMLNELVSIANRKYQQIHFFGGEATANPPLVGLNGAWKYQGQGDGLHMDLGLSQSFPVTVSGSAAFGAMSSRVEGDHDLDPQLTADTRLSDLNGARGIGVTLGTINVDVNGTNISVDLTDAHTVQDVIDTLEAAIQTEDPGATVQIDPVTGNRLEIIPSGGVTVTITDPGADAAAADLGIAGTFDAGTTTGEDLDPRLTELTPLSALTGVTVPLGTIRLTNGNQMRDLDLSGAETVRDVMNEVAALKIGIRVELHPDGDRLNFLNELSGSSMSVGEVGGGATATELGVRSLTTTTRLEDFNDGLGVQILSGAVDPVTGLPDPAADLDFRVTLKNGTTFDVDLAGSETVQDVLDTVNAAAAAAGVAVPAEFEATLVSDGNGIALTDNTPPGGGTTSVTRLNGSFAAEDLGILGSTTGATLTGEDRATVAVDSVFSHLITLRDALRTNDERGISLATDKLEQDVDRLAQVRGEVGARTRRVTDADAREEELRLQDISLRSQVQDLEYTEAAIEFAVLQQQLQAGLQTASRLSSISLLDFLR